MNSQHSGGRTEAHADRGLRGAVAGYHGYPQLKVGALAPSASDEPVVSVILGFWEGSAAAAIEVVPVPTDDAQRAALFGRVARGLQIDMTPMGASRLMGVPADRLSAGDLVSDDVLGPDLPRLMARLASAPTWAIRFAAADEFLLKRLEHAPRRSLSAGAAWRTFAESPGMVLIGELAPVVEPEATEAEAAVSPGDPYDVHTAAAERMSRRYHQSATDSTAAPKEPWA